MVAEFLTTADAAKVLGVTPATVRAYEESGRLPAVRTAGGYRLFLRTDVARLASMLPLPRGRRRR